MFERAINGVYEDDGISRLHTNGVRFQLSLAALLASALVLLSPASAQVSSVRLSADPFTNASSQHATQVEPDTFAFGSTIVSAFQSGRFFDGGSSDIGFATSSNSGASWTNGFLSGITKYQGAGPFDRVSDPAVAYDASHHVWLIVSLALKETPSLAGVAVLVSRSSDGLSWSNPVTVATGSNLDKTWIACDNSASSPFYGHCYAEWDNPADFDRIKMSTSTNGGASWGAALNTGDNATGLGGQPVVQPNGQVIVPIMSASGSAILSFRSVDGGASWRSTVTVASISDHAVAGGLRSEPLPSAEVDGAGNVYVVWQDCRFRTGCASNDIVMATTTQAGYPTWSGVSRIPIDPSTSSVDHFIPGLAVDPASFGSTAKLALAYYYYPQANCSSASCQLDVGLVSSSDGGSSWSTSSQLAGPIALSWLASTSLGLMVGDYISTSFAGGTAHPVFAVANPPSGGVFDEAIYTTGTTGPSDFSISANPSSLSVAQGDSGSSTISTAVTSGSAQTVSLSASGQPAGTTVSFSPTSVTAGGSSTMTVSVGSSTALGNYTITVTGTGSSAVHTTTVSLSVTTAAHGVVNGGFETGNLSGWTTSGAYMPVISTAAHTGSYSARLGSTSAVNGDSTLTQTVAIPSGNSRLTFWYQPHCPDTLAYDQIQMQIRTTSGATLATVLNVCSNSGTWTSVTYDTSAYAGQTVVLWFNDHDDGYATDPTYFLLDDVAVNTYTPAPNVVQNPGFETGVLSPWSASGAFTPVITTSPHSGSYAARLGSSSAVNGNSTITQTLIVPAGLSTLTFWYQPHCPDTLAYDQIQMQIRSTSGSTLATVLNVCTNSGVWTQASFNTTPYAGQTVVLWFNDHDDGYPTDPTYFLLDDVSLSGS